MAQQNLWQYQQRAEPIIYPVPETITMEKWFRETQRPPKGPKRWEFLYPSLFYEGYPRFAATPDPIKGTTDFSKVAKATTDFTKTTKNTTAFSKATKNTTDFTAVV